MNAEKAYRELLSLLSQTLIAIGFECSGEIFRMREDCNIAVIAFQKSRLSGPLSVQFTINTGVFCNRIRRILEGSENSVPDIEECQLRQRIGFLLPDKSDKWWNIASTTDLAGLQNELELVLIDVGIPFLKRFLNDNNLCHLWISGSSPGLTEFERLINVSTLTIATGKKEEFLVLCDLIRTVSSGKPWARSAEAHIQKLRSFWMKKGVTH